MGLEKIKTFSKWFFYGIIALLTMFLILIVFWEDFMGMSIKMREYMQSKSSLKVNEFYNVIDRQASSQITPTYFGGKKKGEISCFSFGISNTNRDSFIQILPNPKKAISGMERKSIYSSIEKYLHETNIKTPSVNMDGDFYKIFPRRGLGYIYLSPTRDTEIDIVCVYIYI